MKRILSVLALVVAFAAALAAVVALKQNPVSFHEVHPEIQPIEPRMVDIPAGSFMRGNPTGTPMEQPVRTITVAAFRIGTHEVTNAEWKRFVDATGRAAPVQPLFAAEGPNFPANYYETYPDHPAVEMSWTDAAAYCAWLAKKTGKDYHLPTDAQWERAARGGLDGKEFFWGDDRRDGMAQMNSSWRVGPVKVGSFPPNGYGLYDVAGNVNEMVQDWYVENYYASAPETDPVGPSGLSAYLSLVNPVGRSRLKGRCHVVRGGSYRAPWDWHMRNPDNMLETPVQVGAREYVYQEPYTHFDLGFRVAEGGVWK